MNHHEPHSDDERSPEERELAALYRNLPQASPDARLDAAILDAATRAVAPAARRRPRWPIALGTAATLVLAAGLAWRMRDEPTRAPPTAPAPVIEARDPAPASAPAAAVAEQATELPLANASSVVREKPLAKTMMAPGAMQAIATRRNEAPRAEKSPGVQLLAPGVEPMPAQSPSPPPAPPAPAARQAITEGFAADAPGSATRNAETVDSPERRVAEIRKRLRTGDRDGAKEALAALRKQYPDYRLPSDLRQLGR
jgi:Meckel syndrome type 1 protein